MKRRFLSLILLTVFYTFNLHSQTTGLLEDFAQPIDDGWLATPQYGLSQENESLKISVDKFQAWAGFKYVLPEAIDMTANPYINIRVKGTLPFIFHVYITDSVNNIQFPARVMYNNDQYTDITYDFSAPGSVNLSAVKELIFAVNGAAVSFEGTVWIDDLRIGDQASKRAYMSSVQDVQVYKNSTGNRIKLTDIKNGSAPALSGGETLIENVSFSEIVNGKSYLTFDCINDATGSETITISLTGNSGYTDFDDQFDLTIESNNAPVMDNIENIDAPADSTFILQLTGISDGNSSLEQTISIQILNGDNTVVTDPTLDYSNNGSTASLNFTTLAEGTSTITVNLTDNGADNNVASYNFDVVVYDNFNFAPQFDVDDKYEMFLSEGTIQIPLNNIDDGDDDYQTVSYAANSLNTGVVGNPVTISYTEGNPLLPVLNCTASGIGTAKIEITVSDEAPLAGNGNKSTTKTIEIDVKEDPIYGLIIDPADFETDTTNGLYKLEGQGVAQTFSHVNFDDSECLKIDCNAKGTWTGFWYRTPDIDMADNPFISYEIYSVDNAIQTHAYLWDNNGARNADGAHAERKNVPANQWTQILMDFRQPGELVDGNGDPINIARIDTILFNYHPGFGWPFTNYTGTLYIRNIKIGDEVTGVAPLTPVATIDPVPQISVFKSTGEYTHTFTGISSGDNNVATPQISLTYNQAQEIFSDISVSAINESGEAELTFTTTSNTGSLNVTVEITATGAESISRQFILESVENEQTGFATVNVDVSQRNQHFSGFGAASPDLNLIDQFANDVEGEIIRFFFHGNSIEPLNDNNNPNAIDKSAFNYSGLNLGYIRKAYEAGIERFFVTVLSPPAWMKENLSTNYQGSQAPAWASTQNKVDTIYYDEYVEFMVAIVEIIKDETGVELDAICPQNEPAFNQPYGSAVLDPKHMAEVCGMLGEKLAQKGFSTRVINSEQVFSQGNYSVNDYIDAVQANPLANEYTSIVAMHYPSLSVSDWSLQSQNCFQGDYPKEYWATECKAAGNEWDKVMTQLETIILGLNYGLSSWTIFGWNQGALFSNDYNPVGDQIGVVYGGTPSKHFHALKNLYHSIKPGAYQLETTSDNSSVRIAAFIHDADETISIVLLNKSTSAVKVKVEGNIPSDYSIYRTSTNEMYVETDPTFDNMVLLPPQSITTLIGKTNINHAPTVNRVKDLNIKDSDGVQQVDLSGITDGDIDEQIVDIEVSVSTVGMITTPVIDYSSPENSGIITFSPIQGKIGTIVVTVTLTDDGGVENGGMDTKEISFNVNITSGTSIEDISANLQIFPNPVEDVLTVKMPSSDQSWLIKMYNIQGQQVLEKEYQISAGGEVKIETEQLNAGIYTVEFSNNNKHGKVKVIKK